MGHPSIKKKEGPSSQELALLVNQAKEGSQDALASLIEQTQTPLYRFLLYLTGDRASADDLIQETYVKAIENLAKLKDPSRIVSWLMRTGKNLFIDQHRSGKKMDEIPETGSKQLKQDPHLDLDLSVQQTLGQLKPEDRLLLLLVDMESCSYGEAAEILGMTEDALRSKLHRVRKTFLKKYEDG